MKTGISGMAKWLALAVFVLAAGCFYSCGAVGQPVGLSHAETLQMETSQMEPLKEEPSKPETDAAPKTCFVHVCGAVAEPGVYELSDGQRVFEAVELAGGFTAEAADGYLNLAEPVQDGMKVWVPEKGEVSAEAALGDRTGSGPAKLNINTATKEELMTLRGIGEARAEDIIRYRQKRGGFDRIEDIMEVSGIKDAAFQKMKDDITV